MSFDEFFSAHYDEVVRTLALAVGDRGRAEDAAQEAFARAFRKWSTVSTLERPVGWVVVVGINQLRRWITRVDARDARAVGALAVAAAPSVDDHAGAVERRLEVVAALDRLPARQRATVVLRVLCDLPVADVARALGCAPGTVKSSLHQALVALRVDADAAGVAGSLEPVTTPAAGARENPEEDGHASR